MTADVPHSFDAWAASLGINANTLSPDDEAALQLAFEALSPRTPERISTARYQAGIAALTAELLAEHKAAVAESRREAADRILNEVRMPRRQ